MADKYFVKSNDYTYRPFEHQGFSGSLLLATPAQKEMPQLLVKHEMPCSACCEFVYSRLAQELQLPVAESFLVKVNGKDEARFKTPYVVGITYLEGLQKFSLEDVQQSPQLTHEYAGHYALAVMFGQADLVQMSRTPSGHIVCLDFTDCFRLGDLRNVSIFQEADLFLEDYLVRILSAFKRDAFSLWINAGKSVVEKHLAEGHPSIEAVNSYQDTLKRFCAIPEQRIAQIVEPLDEIYPVQISIYFEEYAKILKRKIRDCFNNAPR